MKTPPSDLPPVPEGFDYYGMGPLKETTVECDHDVALFTPEDGWSTRWSGVGPHHYALRSGSPIALANGLVPPAPAEEPMHPDPRHGRFREMFHAAHPNPAYTSPMPTTEAAAARTLVEAFAEQIRELKADLEMSKAREAKTPWQRNGETQEEWLARQHEKNAAREATQYGYWERVMTALNQPNDARSLIDQAVAAIKERDELKQALAAAQSGNRSLADEVDALKKERARLCGMLDTCQAGNKRRDAEIEIAKGNAEQLSTERYRLMDELARVRETLRGFYAAAEAMAKEGAL